MALARLGDACASVVVLLAATLMMAAFSGGPCSFLLLVVSLPTEAARSQEQTRVR